MYNQFYQLRSVPPGRLLLKISIFLSFQMVRNYKRKTERFQWSEEAMACAINDVKNNVKKLRQAARAYNIPVMTLSDRLKTGNSKKPNFGIKPTFTREQEHEIADQVFLMAKMFYGISSVELRRLVYEYAEVNKIPHTFNKAARLAGQDWLCGFLARNPRISVRKPEATSISRITAFNKKEVDLFFSNLETEFDKHKFQASQIYNFDETGISTVQKPGRILGPKGVKQVGAATSWERGKNITIACAMSASGEYIPPMFIFPRKRMSPNLVKGGPPNAIYHCSANGWMTEDLFVTWLHHFIANAKPSKEKPVLLVLDNHSSHTTLQSYNVCKDNGIVMVTLPPHSSHRLQPLDITFFSSLKAAFNKECDNFLKSHPHEKITPYDIAAIFNNAYVRVANIEKGVSGFAAAGIYPLDTQKFNEQDFAVQTVEQNLPIIEDKEIADDVFIREEEDPMHNAGNSTTIRNNMERILNPALLSSNLDLPSTSRSSMDSASSPRTEFTAFKALCPTPCSSKTNVPSRQQHSTTFTQTPNKKKLEEAAEVRALKLKIQELRGKIKLKKEEKDKSRKFCVKGNSRLRKTNSKVGGPTGIRQPVKGTRPMQTTGKQALQIKSEKNKVEGRLLSVRHQKKMSPATPSFVTTMSLMTSTQTNSLTQVL